LVVTANATANERDPNPGNDTDKSPTALEP